MKVRELVDGLTIREDLWKRHYDHMETDAASDRYPEWGLMGWRPLLFRYWFPIRLLGGRPHFGLYTRRRAQRHADWVQADDNHDEQAQ